MKLRRLSFLLAVLPLGIAPWLPAQVMQLSGFGSSISGTEGASLTHYDDNATSRVSLGAAQGMHLGLSREVTSGPVHLTLGDSHPSLALPSDLDGNDRGVYATGALLQVGSPDRNIAVFAGRSGVNYGNAFFSGVSAEKPMLLSSSTVRTGSVLWHTLLVHGEQHAMIASAQVRLHPRTLLAFSAGKCAGKPVLRASFQHVAQTWRIDASSTSGHLQLQPQNSFQISQLERIGLNLSASERLRQWLTVDVARHEYATGTTDLPSSPAPSTIGARSTLLEAGATAYLGDFRAGVRLLGSSTGSAHDHSLVWIGSWRRRLTGAQAMVLRRVDLQGTTSTLQLDADRDVVRHLRLRTGMQLGSGAPHADVGGTIDGNWGSLSFSHGETYIPFGTQAGFRRVLTVALRMHVHNADVGLARVSATGIPSVWEGSVNDFESAGDTTSSNGPRLQVSMPKYRLQGTVLDGSNPVAGAAVAVGNQLLYTDSSGHWMARFDRAHAVRVALQPSEFLTIATYRALTDARIETPLRDTTPLELKVIRCKAPEHPATQSFQVDADQIQPHRSILHAIAQFGAQVVHLWPRRSA